VLSPHDLSRSLSKSVLGKPGLRSPWHRFPSQWRWKAYEVDEVDARMEVVLPGLA
jgi:hypothetical protein